MGPRYSDCPSPCKPQSRSLREAMTERRLRLNRYQIWPLVRRSRVTVPTQSMYDPDAVTDRGKRPIYADDRQSGTIYCTSRATSRSHGVVTATGIYKVHAKLQVLLTYKEVPLVRTRLLSYPRALSFPYCLTGLRVYGQRRSPQYVKTPLNISILRCGGPPSTPFRTG
jgi:hypothetical protein